MNKHEKVVAFCPVCGKLEVKGGFLIHPAFDELVRKTYESAMKTNYTGEQESERKEME
ncbi:MAG: hypothetical protein WC763_05305 [Candidatus Paceibacterota bacterium]|jgi:hypothetical protein